MLSQLAVYEMRKLFVLLLRTTPSENEMNFGDPVRGLQEEIENRGVGPDEFIQENNDREFRLNGAGLKILIRTDSGYVVITGDQVEYYKDFLNAIKQETDKFKRIRVHFP